MAKEQQNENIKFSTFVMSETTRNQIKALPPEMQLKFFWAVTDFGLDGINPDFDGLELAIWIPMRDLILNSKRQDEAWHLKQRNNGKKGGRPKKAIVIIESDGNPDNPRVISETQKTHGLSGFSEKNPKTHNDNDNNNVNANDNVNDFSGSAEPPGEKSSSSQKPDKSKKPPLREREPVNDMERVEKAYLQNWDTLYSQKQVETADPIVNWTQTRKLLKKHFVKLKPEQIILALNNGLKDDWVMNGGYSFGVMLSASVLNRLINSAQGEGKALADKESLTGLKSIF